ncbi:hypothetical protein B0H13DRAFT_2651844 [Mycena leptocephala]|nr:hypothetical protein B0H13DRAFT_2651844 [Mycena leptocephala]
MLVRLRHLAPRALASLKGQLPLLHHSESRAAVARAPNLWDAFLTDSQYGIPPIYPRALALGADNDNSPDPARCARAGIPPLEEVFMAGSSTSNLSDHPQKVKGLIGITLGAMCPVAVLHRIHSAGPYPPQTVHTAVPDTSQRVIVLKDRANKESHADSAQVACDATGSIRTVAVLMGEEYCLERYSNSNSLLWPLRDAKRAALRSSLLYALSQTTLYWVLALIFWYGAVLVSRQEVMMFQFFITLMAAMFESMNAGFTSLGWADKRMRFFPRRVACGADYRSRMVLVSQEPTLYAGTVRCSRC